MKFFTVFLLILSITSVQASICNEWMTNFIRIDHEADSVQIDSEIAKHFSEASLVSKSQFEKLYAKCISPNKNLIKNNANKKSAELVLGMSLATTIVGYSHENWDKTKDNKWFAKLGYNLIFSLLSAKIYAKFSSVENSKYRAMIEELAFNRITTIMSNYGEITLFADDHDSIVKINELKENGDLQQELKNLVEYLNNERVIKRFEENIITHLTNSNIKNIFINHGNNSLGIDLSDQEDSELKNLILSTISIQMYEYHKIFLSNRKSIHKIINHTFLFDTIFTAVKIPKDMYLQNITSRILCLNYYNPIRGMTQAIGVNALNQIIFADNYGISYQILKKNVIDN